LPYRRASKITYMKLLIIAVSCLVYGGIFCENWFILECDLVCADFAIGLRGGIRRITQTTRKERSSCIKNCSKHTPCCLTVSIISHICQQSYLLLLGIPSPTHFHSRLKTSLFCKSFPPQPFLFFFRIHYMDSSDCLLLFLSISVFYF